jgi:hypothetical protein
VEAKHLQLSTVQIDKCVSDYSRSSHPHSSLTTNISLDHDKSSSNNTSLNSTVSSSTSSSLSNRSGSKTNKTTRTTKQTKLSPVKTELGTGVTDEYSSTPCYNTDEYYYSANPPANYSNLALYAANYSSPSCFSTLNNTDESIYYECQQKKRLRLDNDHHPHHLTLLDYESNVACDKMNFYGSPAATAAGNCYISAAAAYPTDHHPYHHASVIVDSQQYFLNGWNGTAAF